MSDPHPIKTIIGRFFGFMANTLMFAVALSLTITIVCFGLDLMRRGSQQCLILAQTGNLDRWLHTACGCASVEGILLILSLISLRFSAPRLWRDYCRFGSLRRHKRPFDTNS
jgi:hypothetical protein